MPPLRLVMMNMVGGATDCGPNLSSFRPLAPCQRTVWELVFLSKSELKGRLFVTTLLEHWAHMKQKAQLDGKQCVEVHM